MHHPLSQTASINIAKDRLDATLLARFGALLEPSIRPVLSPTLDAMKEFMEARQAVIQGALGAGKSAKITLA